MSGVGLPLSPSEEPLGISVERTPLAAVSIALQSEGDAMPIAILRFTLPEEEVEFRTATQGRAAKSTIWDIDQKLRSLLKHGEPTEEEARLAEEIRGMIPSELLED